jgi:hypothetical protein
MRYHSFDLEGIAVDGYGYVVTITAENGKRHKTKSRNNCLFGRNATEESMWSVGRAAFRPREASMIDKPAIEIVTTRSLEMRESFYEERDRKWSQR